MRPEGISNIDLTTMMRVRHWSGCMNGVVPQSPVNNKTEVIEAYLRQKPWLAGFLQHTDSRQIKIEQVDKTDTRSAFHSEIVGRFNILTMFQKVHSPEYYIGSPAPVTWVVVTCIDGKPLHSVDSKYDGLLVGRGQFMGYRLEHHDRSRYTLRYRLTLVDGVWGELWFPSEFILVGSEPQHESVIATNLYCLKDSEECINLAEKTPLKTTLLVHTNGIRQILNSNNFKTGS